MDRRVWRYVVGDPASVGGLLSGARSVYEYYGRSSSYGFAPGGIRDYSAPTLPLVPAQSGPISGAGAVIATGAVLSAVSNPTAPSTAPVRESAGHSTPPSDDGPAPNPESIYARTSRPPTDWAQVAREVAVLNPEFEEERPPAFIPVDAGTGEPDPYEPVHETEIGDAPMPSFWDIASGVVDVIQGQPVGNVQTGFAPPLTPSSGTGPAVTYQRNAAGQLVPCRRRRRRRRLLTESDFNDLMRISTLPNKENVRITLAKAIGRR